MARGAGAKLVGERVTNRHGFLWPRTGHGTVRATYEKAGRRFATVELDGSGKLLPRLVSQLQDVGTEKAQQAVEKVGPQDRQALEGMIWLRVRRSTCAEPTSNRCRC